MDALNEVGLRAYIARAEPHEPVCVGSAKGNDDGLFVQLYTRGGQITAVSAKGNDDGLFVQLYTRGGQITAVEVYDGLTEGALTIVGLPAPKEQEAAE